MNNYIFVSTYNGDISALHIIANNFIEALVKAYSYFGGDSRLTYQDFKLLLKNKEPLAQIKLFEDFVGEKILYFTNSNNSSEYINDLPKITDYE